MFFNLFIQIEHFITEKYKFFKKEKLITSLKYLLQGVL